MEDSFSVRVGKVFGSLAGGSLSISSSSAAAPSSSLSSLWSLTDEEIERREWNRDKSSPEPQLEFQLDPQPCNSNSKNDFSNEIEKDLLDLDDGVEEEEEDEDEEQLPCGPPTTQSGDNKPHHYKDEEWEIKSAIGRDCTLDYEEEEDRYDKVAIGKENDGDRLYMKDVNDYAIDIDPLEEVPNSFKDFTRDPRANHLAAKIRLQQDAEAAAQIRLQEDAEAARGIDSLKVSANDTPDSVAAEIITAEDSTYPKSILKRQNDDQLDSSRAQKRVRFDPVCKSNCDEGGEGANDVPVETHTNEDHRVPDYLRNPSRYTHYTFDDSSNDVDDESNKQACMDLLHVLRKSNSMELQAEDAPFDIAKPVTFIPRKKSTDAVMVENDGGEAERVGSADREFAPCRGIPLVIADVDNEDVCAMEEDGPEAVTDGRTSLQRTGRQYRTKTRLELDE